MSRRPLSQTVKGGRAAARRPGSMPGQIPPQSGRGLTLPRSARPGPCGRPRTTTREAARTSSASGEGTWWRSCPRMQRSPGTMGGGRVKSTTGSGSSPRTMSHINPLFTVSLVRGARRGQRSESRALPSRFHSVNWY